MSERDFYTPQMRDAVASAVASVELQTCAEVMVAVRGRAGAYRHTDYLFGSLVAFATLLVLLFYPRSFNTLTMPLEVLVMFGLGTVACANAPLLRTLLTRRSYRQKQVALAARAAFYDMGVSKTRDRTGVLVFVAVLEREVALVTDVGILASAIDARAIEASVKKLDASAFVAALQALGPALCAAHPHADDDLDELPNVPQLG